MSFTRKVCIEIVCDGGCDNPWSSSDDISGVPHFASEQEAVEEAERNGWTVIDGRALCSDCTTKAICERTGHQWDVWRRREQHGIVYRSRWCEHCGDYDYDPPLDALYPKFQALRDAEEIVRSAGGSGDGR